MRTKKVFFNKAQLFIIEIAARILFLIASRRFGKSEGIISPILLRNVQQMPRGQHAILSTTYKQALTRTLPGTIHGLSRLGYTEGNHFFSGRKAPEKAGFPNPYIIPKDWSHYIHWYNGSVSPIISQDVPYSSNSLTLSSIIADEAKTLSHPKLIDETLPAITPLAYFHDCPWDGSQTYVTDMPTTKSGMWILEKEKDMNPEIIQIIQGLIFEIYKIKKQEIITPYFKKKIKELENQLAFFRKEAVLFVTYSILDNLEVVGESYIKDRYRDLPLGKFLTSIMSYRLKMIDGGYYAALSEKHYYTAYDNGYLSNFRKDDGTIDYKSASDTIFNCAQDIDIDHSMPLHIAADSNININWLVVGQPNYGKKTAKTLKSFWLKHPAMLQEVCEAFCDYYQPLPNKQVVFFYDHTFLQGKSAISAESFADTIIRVLQNRDFYVYPVYIGQAWAHDKKHKEIDSGLKGFTNLKPLFNKPNNEDLITAMEKTGTSIGRLGWGKDKSDEKDEESEDNPSEHRTDGTDAWDTLYLGLNFYRSDYHVMGSDTSMGK